ncbi:inhibitor of KinA [Leeuwenhoekiella aestuarii]|uniref:5-oxoprolinase subunit PxpB n=1 Tax=Leeuwenhoekiella aestuarii TaxID=2249426 RepID=UPI000FFE8E28|nr:5-oxoprolinase subunit PxpB [Leeuwenhoekiella aestuarii]RXG17585.1 inhibitor of KinA [Leeuwenhoekiella aestuarii]
MQIKPSINRLGEKAILLQWDFNITPENLNWLLSVKQILQQQIVKSKVQVVNTYNSLLIIYNYSIENIYNDFRALKSYDFTGISSEDFKGKLYRLPVCYDVEFGLDLDELARRNSLTISEIIHLHTQPIYTLYFMGFLPGFLYLGGMNERLKISRKNEPRKSVLKGAVGIAENQTGIYPNSSPAGWQIIGNCPVELFNAHTENPCPFKAGDQIQFYSVSKQEYAKIKQKIEDGIFELKPESHA